MGASFFRVVSVDVCKFIYPYYAHIQTATNYEYNILFCTCVLDSYFLSSLPFPYESCYVY